MKRFIITSAALLLMAGSALADPAEIIKQKALGIRDMNNQRQGIIANSGNSAPAAAPAPAAPAGPSSSQQALIDRLQTDLTAIKPGTPTNIDLATGLQNDMGSLAKGANKPTKPELTKLSTDLSAALAEKTVPASGMSLLAREINIVCNCAILTPAQAQTYVSAAQSVLKNGGVSDASVKAVGDDLHAIVNEIQKSKPKLYQ